MVYIMVGGSLDLVVRLCAQRQERETSGAGFGVQNKHDATANTAGSLPGWEQGAL